MHVPQTERIVRKLYCFDPVDENTVPTEVLVLYIPKKNKGQNRIPHAVKADCYVLAMEIYIYYIINSIDLHRFIRL